MATPTKIKLHLGEKIEILPYPKTPKGYRYAVTNHGRIISFTDSPSNGHFLKPSNISKYPGVTIRSRGSATSHTIHRLVAQRFLKPASRAHKFVIHLNYKKDDNHYKNLKWATIEQQFAHYKKSPRYNDRGGNFKLTNEKVRQIKEKLRIGKMSLKALAKKFNVSDMQIHRIKTGENWSHIKI